MITECVKPGLIHDYCFLWLTAVMHFVFVCRPDTLDPALLRPGRLDRKVEFGLPDLESRTQIFKIHTRTMNCERDIRFELLARLCPNSTGNLYALTYNRMTHVYCSRSCILNINFLFDI